MCGVCVCVVVHALSPHILTLPPPSTPHRPSHSTPHGGSDDQEEDGRKTPSINVEEGDENTPLMFVEVDSRDDLVLPGADLYNAVAQKFLAWNLPLVLEGWSTPIHKSRIPLAKAKFDSRKVGQRMAMLWEAEKARKPEAPRLISAVLELIKRQLVVSCAVAVVQGVLSTVARPLILREIVNEIAAGDVELDEATLLLVQLALVVFVEGWLAVSTSLPLELVLIRWH